MNRGLDLAIREVVEEMAGRIGEVEVAVVGQVTELRREGRPFVVLDADHAQFRLGLDVAGPAMRTPGVVASPRGPEWVQFRPERLDRFALDRATSWTELAWRRAAD